MKHVPLLHVSSCRLVNFMHFMHAYYGCNLATGGHMGKVALGLIMLSRAPVHALIFKFKCSDISSESREESRRMVTHPRRWHGEHVYGS